jgi:hypothetical protein
MTSTITVSFLPRSASKIFKFLGEDHLETLELQKKMDG